VTGDKEMQREGKLDKVKGAAHNAAGEVKEVLYTTSLCIGSAIFPLF
jgi:uncharacterized protein YjbJ (UPF0337 family)